MSLDVQGTDFLKLPVGTTAQRLAWLEEVKTLKGGEQ